MLYISRPHTAHIDGWASILAANPIQMPILNQILIPIPAPFPVINVRNQAMARYICLNVEGSQQKPMAVHMWCTERKIGALALGFVPLVGYSSVSIFHSILFGAGLLFPVTLAKNRIATTKKIFELLYKGCI